VDSRRICPGRFLSDNSLFCIISSVLSVFDISAGINPDGSLVKVEPKWTDGLVQCALVSYYYLCAGADLRWKGTRLHSPSFSSHARRLLNILFNMRRRGIQFRFAQVGSEVLTVRLSIHFILEVIGTMTDSRSIPFSFFFDTFVVSISERISVLCT
jgi:hypothetical protein